jgi:hypothetical protein
MIRYEYATRDLLNSRTSSAAAEADCRTHLVVVYTRVLCFDAAETTAVA